MTTRRTTDEWRQIVADYTDNGLGPAAIHAKWGVSRRYLYTQLGRFGVTDRRRQPCNLCCVVCGAPRPPEHHRTHPTCRELECSSLLLTLPQLAEDKPVRPTAPTGRETHWERCWEFTAAIPSTGPIRGALYRHEESTDRVWHPSTDERGAEAHEAAKRNPFSRLNRHPVGLLLRSSHQDPYAPALQLAVDRGTPWQTLLQQYFGGDEAYARSFDILIAWQCPCPQHHTVLWTVDTLPTTLGPHGACPRCGALPLEVIR